MEWIWVMSAVFILKMLLCPNKMMFNKCILTEMTYGSEIKILDVKIFNKSQCIQWVVERCMDEWIHAGEAFVQHWMVVIKLFLKIIILTFNNFWIVEQVWRMQPPVAWTRFGKRLYAFSTQFLLISAIRYHQIISVWKMIQFL